MSENKERLFNPISEQVAAGAPDALVSFELLCSKRTLHALKDAAALANRVRIVERVNEFLETLEKMDESILHYDASGQRRAGIVDDAQ